MNNTPGDAEVANRLRQRAEEALRGKPVDLSGFTLEDLQNLVHELQVHQVELSLQNEELRSAQVELETASDQLSNLYNFAPVGYCTLDHKGHILEANRTLAVLLGVYQQELIQKKLSDFVVRVDQDAFYLHQQRTFEDDQRQVIELEIDNQTGKRIFVRLESQIDTQNQDRMRVILSDITEQKQAEQELEHYAQELERANQGLQDFSFIASHDLQEPLRKVKSFGGLLREKYGAILGVEGEDYLARMMSAAARMDSMIQGLLAYARVTTKGVTFEQVNLKQIALEALSDLDGRILQTGGKVIIDELPNIKADPLQMRQLFQNLISNALKYHRPGIPPVVTVSSGPEANGQVEITVSDNGIGIHIERKDYIFEPFTRLSARPDHDGSGMGLAICKKIIERHHGSITVSDNPEEGSTFTVTLPT